MTQLHHEQSASRSVSLASMIVSLIAITIAAYSVVAVRSAEQRAYQRVVDETWRSVQPFYKEFGVKEPSGKPASIADMLTPLFTINHDDAVSPQTNIESHR